MIPFQCHELVLTYVKTCCETHSPEDFRKILSKKAELSYHFDEDEMTIEAEKRDTIVEIFQINKFNGIFNIDQLSYQIETHNPKIKLVLRFNAKIKDKNLIKKYSFLETTYFQFKKKKDASYKIQDLNVDIKTSLLSIKSESNN